MTLRMSLRASRMLLWSRRVFQWACIMFYSGPGSFRMYFPKVPREGKGHRVFCAHIWGSHGHTCTPALLQPICAQIWNARAHTGDFPEPRVYRAPNVPMKPRNPESSQRCCPNVSATSRMFQWASRMFQLRFS